jgi:hypothetical protein
VPQQFLVVELLDAQVAEDRRALHHSRFGRGRPR